MNTGAQRLTQNKWGFIAFMSIMCSLGPISLSFLVPAFPTIATEFNKSVADIQFLVSIFLIGHGVAQPIQGMLADRFGRRPVLLIGFAVFILASLASIMTTNWTALVICRFLQAVGVSVGTVISRAIVNDVQPREEAAISLAYISMAMGAGPILAPILGGTLDSAFGWRSIFIGCFIAGVIVWAMGVWRLPETRPANNETPNVLKNYSRLFRSSQFIGYTLMLGFGQCIFFSFLPFAPDYFENVLGQSTSIFITSWIALTLTFMAGSFLGTRLTKKYGMDSVIFWASIWLTICVVVQVSAYHIFNDSVLSVVLPLMLLMVGTGLTCPLSLAGSVSFDPKLAATAAGLSSSLGFVVGGLFSVLAGKLYNQTLWPYLLLVAIAVLGNMIAMSLTRRGRST